MPFIQLKEQMAKFMLVFNEIKTHNRNVLREYITEKISCQDRSIRNIFAN